MMQGLELIDTHAHVSFKDYGEEDVPLVLARAREAGVVHIVTIGAGDGLSGNDRARALAEAYPDLVSFTVGVHPHDAALLSEDAFAVLKEATRHPQAVAIGEVGLDYYYEHSPRDRQRFALERFVSLARETGLPLVIHDRGADEECHALVNALGAGAVRGVVHCFTGTLALAKKYLDSGFLLSFTGIVTFKKAEDVRDVVRYVPLERMMIETDSPFLAPVPFRGKRNEPAYVCEVAKAVAAIKGVSLDEVAAATTATARRFFALK